jgi:lipid-binding SYLF domain-containing protein
MKTTSLLLISAIALTSGNLWAASGRQDSIERLQMSSEVLHSIMSAPDKGIPEEVMNGAKCIVVVPHLVKGGFVVGGEHGRGIASCRTADGWSAPAFVSVGGGSWGLQIGVEGVDLVMVVMNDRGLQHLLSSKFQISGDASASAGPVGRHASAGTDWTLTTEVLTYSRSHGIFAGITLNGAVVEQRLWSRTPTRPMLFMAAIRPSGQSCRAMYVHRGRRWALYRPLSKLGAPARSRK